MHERLLVRRWSDSMINTTDIMPFITRDPGCVAYGTALQLTLASRYDTL